MKFKGFTTEDWHEKDGFFTHFGLMRDIENETLTLYLDGELKVSFKVDKDVEFELIKEHTNTGNLRVRETNNDNVLSGEQNINIKNDLKKFKKTIVFDFDGVIHDYKEGWKDGSIYGKINLDVLVLMEKLLKNYTICISSTRSAEQIYNHMTKFANIHRLKFELMENKVPCFWNKEGVIGITNMKPAGVIYIDDRALHFDINNECPFDLCTKINTIIEFI